MGPVQPVQPLQLLTRITTVFANERMAMASSLRMTTTPPSNMSVQLKQKPKL